MKQLKYIFLSMVFSLWFASVNAQSNPASIYQKIIIGESSDPIILESVFPGLNVHHLVTEVPLGENYGELNITNLGGGNYELILHAAPEEAYIEYILKYYISVTGSNIPQARYIKVQWESVTSIVETDRDYVLDVSSSNSVNVLDNDYSNSTNLDLLEVVRNQEVLSSINGNVIDITSLQNESKMYAQYVAHDEAGTTDNAVVVLVPENAPTEDIVKERFVTNKSILDFTLPSGGYSLDNSYGGVTGELIEVESFAFHYDPDDDFTGQDSIRFNHANGKTYTIYFNVFDQQFFNGFVTNDVVYTARNETVLFDVKANDLESSHVITSSSADDVDELVDLGNGLFSYTPPADYVGVVNFEYTGVFLAEQQTAEIKIVVDDQEPVSYITYDFETKGNTAFVIEYEVPISTAGWYVAQQATNGTVQVMGEGDTLSGDCFELSGAGKIVYTPNDGFTGEDYFEIGYEPTSDNLAYILGSNITVGSTDGSCHCVDGCVWQGDVDNNGVVDLLDLFELGRHFGEVVEERTSDQAEWVGQTSTDDSPSKYADINGDGIVSEADAENFFDYHGNMHSYYRPTDLISSEYAIIFEPQVTEIDSGELLRIDVILGDELFPAIGVNAISFAANVAPHIADSSSMQVVYEGDSWFCHNDPTIALTHVPQDGTLETAVTNTANSAESGIGIIGTLEFIVEEDLDDFRLSEGDLDHVSVTFDDIYIAAADGSIHKLESQTIEVPYNKNGPEETDNYVFDPADLIVYPNPSEGLFNIYLNGPEHIQEVNVFTANGLRITSTSNLNTDSYSIDLNALIDGIYFLQITSENHTYTQKLQVLK